MSVITGKEPKHWHDGDGNHRMPDPRRLAAPQPIAGTAEMSSGMSKRDICVGNPDLAAYWEHLDEHDRLVESPERRTDDSPAVSALFDKLENAQRIVATTGELIIELRKAGK